MALAPLMASGYSCRTHKYRCRIGCAQRAHTPPRGFYANRLILEIKTYWRWGWFRGVATVDKGDHRTS